MTAGESERVAAAHGVNARLVEIEPRYDPENIWRLNQNIRGPSRPMEAWLQPRTSSPV